MLKTLLASIRHPQELSALINYKFFPPNANLKRNELRIANDPSKKKCYDFLFLTSRSFAAVIVELDDELRDAVGRQIHATSVFPSHTCTESSTTLYISIFPLLSLTQQDLHLLPCPPRPRHH